MKTLGDHIVGNARASRKSRARPRPAHHPMREDVGEVHVISSPGLDAATVALPAGIALDDRAERMNEFWKALAKFQYRNVLVVAICAETRARRIVVKRTVAEPFVRYCPKADKLLRRGECPLCATSRH